MRSHVAVAIVLAGSLGRWSDTTDPGWLPREPMAGTETRVYESEKGRFRVTELITGLDHPWGLAFLPGGEMVITERPGRVRLVTTGGVISPPLGGVPRVFVDGQSGLLDVAVSPSFAEDHLVYLSYGEPSFRGNKAGTAVARGRLAEDGLHDVEVIYRQEPKLSSGTHVGSRLVFDDEGFLFVTQGENRQAPTSQELGKLQGKLVRIRPDGSIPKDNPFVGVPGARPEIWSYGHRNMQGAALHPVTRKLWTHEHGPRGGDEINLPEPGRNYGWPIITHGIDYSGLPVPGSVGRAAPGMEPPHYVWLVSPAVSGMAFYTADALPFWKGSLFVGALAMHELIRLELQGDAVVHEERLISGRGERIRDVRQGPDGALYLLTDSDDGKLLRLSAE
jgi:aldose sugar dehydrogenase